MDPIFGDTSAGALREANMETQQAPHKDYSLFKKGLYEPLSKLLVSPLISPIVVPYITPL